MYSVGELIVHSGAGVCRVEEITTLDLPGVNKDRLYYILAPLYQDGTVSVPVESKKIFTRPVISRQEAENLIDQIPTIQAEAYYNQNLTQLERHYRESFENHDCSDLIQLTMSIYAKKQERIEKNLKFGAIDKRFMDRAEDLLYGELAVALGIARDDVHTYIERRLGRI
jgi:Transcriptional regulators, similar to M. xanthus CarD